MREKLNQRELLGLGLDIPGMPSKGTLDKPDALPSTMMMAMAEEEEMEEENRRRRRRKKSPVKLLSVKAVPEELEESEDSDDEIFDDEDDDEEGSDILNASVVSSVVDRYGFMSGAESAAAAPDSLEGDVNKRTVKRKKHSKTRQEKKEDDAELQRRREAKWLDMLDHWDEVMLKNYKKVRERCRKGLPSSVRARAWIHLCGAKYELMNPDNRTTFKRLYNQRGSQKWVDQIEKDLHRNFPTHELFGGTYERIGQAELFRVLKAFSVQHPVDGYCQAMAPVAALLLMNMPAEQAFWCLVMICDKYIPGYYSPGMEAIKLDGDILFGLLKKVSPGAYRVWDMFMCEGVKVLFKVALVLLRSALGTRAQRKACPTMFETLDTLKNAPQMLDDPDQLVEEVTRLNVSEEVMEKEHRKQLKKMKNMKAKQQKQKRQQQQ